MLGLKVGGQLVSFQTAVSKCPGVRMSNSVPGPRWQSSGTSVRLRVQSQLGLHNETCLNEQTNKPEPIKNKLQWSVLLQTLYSMPLQALCAPD